MLKMERNSQGRCQWTNHVLRLASPDSGEVAVLVEGVCGEDKTRDLKSAKNEWNAGHARRVLVDEVST